MVGQRGVQLTWMDAKVGDWVVTPRHGKPVEVNALWYYALLTPMGLRSLSPADPSYCTHYNGNQQQRDGSYHRGTVWPLLIGPYVDVHLSIYKDRAAIRAVLQPLVQHLWDACLGTISEIAAPEPPFTSVGCYAQAWSVAEVLRCWQLV